MRTIQEDFREYAYLDRKRTGDGVTPREYKRWLLLHQRLDKAFSSGPPEGEAERRDSLRVPTRLRVSYDARSGPGGTVTNLSRNGCFIKTDLPAVVGTRLTLLLRGVDVAEAVEIDAEVVSTDIRRDGRAPGDHGMGMRFLSMTPEAQKKLDEIYASLEAGG